MVCSTYSVYLLGIHLHFSNLYNFLTLQAKRLKYHELGAAKAATEDARSEERGGDIVNL